MNLDQVTADIQSWIVNFVEVPHPALGGWPPCPYARTARVRNTFAITIGQDPLQDLVQRACTGLEGKEVWIYAYDPMIHPHNTFSQALEQANQEHLLPQDLIVLEDHPHDPEIVNGVSMNQGTYALALVQGLSDLDRRAGAIARQGFYHSWPESYLQALFQHRQDPRP